MTPRFRNRVPVRALATLGVVAFWVGALAGCGTRTVRDKVFHEGRIEVELRHYENGGEPVERGYAHPLMIGPSRIGDLLSRLQVRDQREGVSSRGPAVEPSILFGVSRGLSMALEQANSTQEVTVVAVHKEKSLGIFDTKFLTSFVAYAKDGELVVHLNRVRSELPRTTAGGAEKHKRLPQPQIGKHPMSFRVVGGEGMRRIGDQSIALALDDDAPVPVRVGTRKGVAGITVRRAVLVLSGDASPGPAAIVPVPAAAEDPAPAALPPHLSPETLRALADLEEARQQGQLSDAEYTERREELLDGP